MIFYFSGTGNSRWAAKTLAAKTGEELVFIPDTPYSGKPYVLKDDERIGWVFPIHGWRPPQLIRDFIANVRFECDTTSHYQYAVCTAGDSIGKAMDILNEDLTARGLRLDAAFTLIMPESYVGLPMMDVDPQHKETRKKLLARSDLEAYANYITDRKPLDRQQNSDVLHKGPIPWFFSYPVGGFFVKHLIKDKPFYVDESRCVRCGKCAEVCPVGNINGGKGMTPQWKHNGQSVQERHKRCMTCFACYHHCPTHAIEYGKRTRNKGQYFYKEEKNNN